MTTQSERKQHARNLFAGISQDYDRWASLLSFGEYTRWHPADRQLAPALTSPARMWPTLRPVPARSRLRSRSATAPT